MANAPLVMRDSVIVVLGKDTPLPRDTGALDLASKMVFPGKYRAPASID